MAQAIQMNEYEIDRMKYKDETISFLEKLRNDLEPLKEDFAMVTGDICCTSCATYEVASDMRDDRKIYGLFWHCQDEDMLNEQGDGLYIGYRGISDSGSKRAADHIVAHLTKLGYRTAWNGDIATRIFVEARPFTAAKKKLTCVLKEVQESIAQA